MRIAPSKLKSEGFTLIELMIVIAILGIFAAFAFPSYQDSVQKSRRSDAQSALIGLSHQMERHFSQNSTYVSAITGSAPQPPDIFSSQVPIGGGTVTYNLTVQAVTASSYILRATPVGVQASDGYFELLSTGARRWNEATTTLRSCWSSTC
jgi:type IV pilus assembly protein PilE